MTNLLMAVLSGVKRLDAGLQFRWQDEPSIVLTIIELRFLCPCANCVSEINGERIIKREDVAADIELVDMQPVGNYAYRILFSDGHDSGIYPLKYVHQLCTEGDE
jgi:DUF971 family protein